MTLAAALLALQPVAPPPPPPPSPMLVAPSPTAIPERRDFAIVWTPGIVRCGTVLVEPLRMLSPLPSSAPFFGTTGEPRGADVAYTFRIDASGRPLTIARDVDDTLARPGVRSLDFEPALAASRFPAGAARTGCRVSYTSRAFAIAAAPIDTVVTLAALPDGLPSTVWRARLAPGASCSTLPFRPRLVAIPAYDRLPARPGEIEPIAIRYDVGPDGVPRNLVPLTAGAADILSETERAILASRFREEAREGCVFIGARTPEVVIVAPPVIRSRPAGATCPANSRGLLKLAALGYPETFRRRGIEGWAVIAFDLAPWGEVGNARVLGAEPAAAFGVQALSVVRAAKGPTDRGGLTGCVVTVRYALPGGRAIAEQDD